MRPLQISSTRPQKCASSVEPRLSRFRPRRLSSHWRAAATGRAGLTDGDNISTRRSRPFLTALERVSLCQETGLQARLSHLLNRTTSRTHSSP